MPRRRKPNTPEAAAAAQRLAELDSALRSMLQDCPLPDRLRDLVEALAAADPVDESPRDDEIDPAD